DAFQTGVVPIPIGPAGVQDTIIAVGSYSVVAGSQHPEEAWKLIRYLTSAEGYESATRMDTVPEAYFNWIPSRIQLARARLLESGNPYDAVWLDVARHARSNEVYHPALSGDPLFQMMRGLVTIRDQGISLYNHVHQWADQINA